MLQHCSKDLEAELCNHTKWDATELTQDAIALLGIICDVTLNLKELRQGTINFVKCDVELKTTAQSSSETIDRYYKVFGAHKDTVNMHGEEAGHHRQMSEDRLAAMLAEKGIARADFDIDGYDEANKHTHSRRELRRISRLPIPADFGLRPVQAPQDSSGERSSTRTVQLP